MKPSESYKTKRDTDFWSNRPALIKTYDNASQFNWKRQKVIYNTKLFTLHLQMEMCGAQNILRKTAPLLPN